jgi:hypothetical protein
MCPQLSAALRRLSAPVGDQALAGNAGRLAAVRVLRKGVWLRADRSTQLERPIAVLADLSVEDQEGNAGDPLQAWGESPKTREGIVEERVGPV